MKKQLLIAILILTSFGLFSQVTVTGGATATYSTMNAAFAAINAGLHTGAISIDITASTTEPTTPTPLVASGQSSANYTSILIRPSATATISGAPTTGRAVLEFDGADNITINGDMIAGPVTRDLTIQNSNAITVLNTAAIRLIGRTTLGLGATNYTITNCNIVGSTPGNDGLSGSTITTSYGIYAGTNAVALSSGSTGDNYDNITITNNSFTRAYFGLYIGSGTVNTADNLIIANNIFGSVNNSEKLSFRGIEVNNAPMAMISQNEIFNLKVNTSVSPAGISTLGTGSNLITIQRNNVYGIWSTSTGGWGAYGINLGGGNNHIVMNNLVSDIFTTNYNSTSTTFQAFGIRIASGTGHRIYYNSVHLFGNYSAGSTTNCYSSALVVTGTGLTGLDIKNNIFSNKQTSNATTPVFMAVWFPAAYNFLNASLNNNAYMVTNDADHYVGRVGTVNYSNLASWMAVSQINNPTNDNQSVPTVNGNAPFISDVNLNFNVNTVTPIESGALTTTLTNIDYDGFTRPKAGINTNANPDIGAYEFDGKGSVAVDAGVTMLVNPITTGCYGAAENMVVQIKNYGTGPLSNIPVRVIVSGAATQTSNATYPGPLAPSATANFTVATLNMLTPGTYNFDAYTIMPGELNAANDTMVTDSRIVIGSVALPQQVSFTGFTGANLPTAFPLWSEATGTAVPTGTTSSWLSQTNLNGPGNITARVNLVATSRNEWIVGPKIAATANTMLSFDAAITAVSSILSYSAMGSDDMVRVMVSNDCGVSYTPVFTVSATNSLTSTFTNFLVNLGAYAGQDIIVAFLAQDGPIDNLESYDFHLDNINLYNMTAIDAGVLSLSNPISNGCYGAAENVIVTVKNFGSSTISNFPVEVRVTGAVTQTVATTYTGSIASLATTTVNVGTLNMTTPGTYSLVGYTGIVGDGNFLNDTMAVVTRSVAPIQSVPQQVSFTGFTGANLPTAFPLWSEATGSLVPAGTTSSWLSQTNLNGPGNITARVNLVATSRNEWIVGPKIAATASTQVSFDAAITAVSSILSYSAMGSDDMVRVMVSNDCGVSYTPVFTVSATNSLTSTFTNFVVNLGAYAGQNIIVAFLAQDGPIDNLETYDFHLDNINLYNALGTDAGATAIVSPITTGCYSASENVVVTLRNFGINPISNIPVTVNISGASTQTVASTYTGTIAPGATANFTVGTANMAMSGTYSLTALTSIAGDSNTFNDAVSETRTVSPVFSINGKKSICSGASSTLTAVGLGLTSYTWSTGANTSSIVVNPSVNTVYSATVSNGTCTSEKVDSVVVTNPTITAMGDVACAPNTGTLTATAFAPVNWYASPTSTISLATGNSYVPTVTTTTTFYAEAQSISNNSITPLMVSNSGSNGNMFDIVALNNIEITGFDVNIGGTLTTTVEVWYRPGSFVGFETSNVGWTNVLTTTVTGLGTDNLVFVPSNFTVAIPAGQTYAFYVTANGGSNFRYTIGTAVGNIYAQNSDLQFLEGKGGGYFSVTNSTRIWNGQIRYNASGCTSPRVAATLTVGTVPSLTITPSSTTLCSGSTATLVANGATSYTWNTGATTQGIAVSPSVSTTYTVTGSNGTCSDSTTLALTVSPSPTVTAASSTTLLCLGNTATLTANGATTYLWNTGAGTQAIAVSPTVTTSYTVTGTSGSCSDSTVITQVVSACTGINQILAESGVYIYPNPTVGSLNVIVTDISSPTIIEFFDALGRKVQSNELNSNSTLINTNELSKGVYVYRIENKNGLVKQGKLIKE